MGFGLLLLTVIMVAHNTSAVNQWDTKYTNLIHELTKGTEELREERDQLKILASNLTQEIEALVASRDKLQEKFDKFNRSNSLCEDGWTKFNNKCYFISPPGSSKSWQNSRRDCQGRGSDLVIITTRNEMNFVKGYYRVTWIGLSRIGRSSRWEWVDGTPLKGDGFWQDGEPNDADGEEDCVELSRDASAWNDVPCRKAFPWVCEK